MLPLPAVLVLFFSLVGHGQLAEQRYLDMHSHVACFGIQSKCFIGESMRQQWFRFKFLEHLFGVSESQIKANGGDAFVVRKISEQLSQSFKVKAAILMAFDMVHDQSGRSRPDLSPFYVPNDFVAQETEKYSNLYFAASVHPYRTNAVEELRRMKTLGAKYIKLIPSIHRFNPDDRRLKEYWKTMARLDLPLLIHVDDEGTFGAQEEQFTGAYKIENALKAGVRVIAAHGGSRGESGTSEDFRFHHRGALSVMPHSDQLVMLAERYPNLYIDISALPTAPHRKYALQKILKEPLWEGRILYGSDFPLNHRFLQSSLYFVSKWGKWMDNGVSPLEFMNILSTDLSSRWDHDIRLKQAFGVPESVFLASEKFFFQKKY